MNKNIRRYFQFLLIVLAAGSIYPLIYLRTNYQETILQVFNMTLPQLNTLYSVLGFVFIIGYFPSGLLSDIFSAKRLLAISLAGTAAGGFWFARVPDYGHVVLIFCVWGVFSVFTFWGSHMKLVKLLAEREEEGRFFGILDGGRGVVEALLASVAVMIFAGVLGSGTDIADKRAALVAVITMYSAMLLVVALLVAVFVQDDRSAVRQGDVKEPERLKAAFSCFRPLFINRYVYLLGGIIFLSYTVTWTIYYFGGFLQTNIKADPVTVGAIMVIVLWMRPLGGILGGFLADRFGKCNVLSVALAVTAACLVLLSLLPAGSPGPLFYSIIVMAGVFLYAIRGTYWSLLGDCGIDDRVIGAAIGMVSVIGYLPDVLLPAFNSFLFSVYGNNEGYNAYFIITAGMGIAGSLLVLTFAALAKRERVS